MGEYEKTRGKQPTAGPSEADRQGAAATPTELESRILKHDVVGGRTRITIARGRTHGIRVGMEGYVKGAGGMLADFQLDEVRDGACLAFVDVMPDQLRNHLHVVLNPRTMPRTAIARDVATRVIHVSVEGGRTKIVISRGSTHGVVVGMRGMLRSIDGRAGEPFTIEGTTATQSFAYVAGSVDHVDQHAEVVLHATARRSPVQRRATGTASTRDVQAVADAGVAGASGRLPHFDTIQRAFGEHDISGIRAQVGGSATDAARTLGAQAYATGDKVAFGATPDLHTAAHEAALAAIPVVEVVVARARAIVEKCQPPIYREAAGHGLWMARMNNDPHVPLFLRALGEIEGTRDLYERVAKKWDARLTQLAALERQVTGLRPGT